MLIFEPNKVVKHPKLKGEYYMKNLFQLSILILLFCISYLAAQEKITNGDFGKGTRGWAIETHEGTTATLDIDTTGILNGDSCAHILITNSDGTNWHLQFQQLIGAISAGDKYYITFQAEASTPASIMYWIQQYHGSYNTLHSMSFNLTTNKQTFKDSMTVDSTDSSVKIAFAIGTLANGDEIWFDAVSMLKANSTSVEFNQIRTVPANYHLLQNYPNPFNPTTVIAYELPVASHAILKIYDIVGRDVATLVNEKKEAGRYDVRFDASRFASGIYFYKLQAGNFSSLKKLVLVK
jgi:hypothetical protein